MPWKMLSSKFSNPLTKAYVAESLFQSSLKLLDILDVKAKQRGNYLVGYHVANFQSQVLWTGRNR